MRDDSFNRIKLSPDGKYIARSIAIGEKSALAITRRSDGVLTGHFNLGGKTAVLDFWWVNDHRLLISAGEKYGALDKPVGTGELYATNADGSGQQILLGYRSGDGISSPHMSSSGGTKAAAFMVDDLPHNDQKVIVQIWPFGRDAPYTRAQELDVVSGGLKNVAVAPVRRADFVTDLEGVVRFATGSGDDNLSRTYYRADRNADWQLLNDQATSGLRLAPLGFSANGATAYLQRDEETGADGIYAMETAGGKMHLQHRDPVVDPARILYGPNREVIGAQYVDGVPKTVLFDETSALAKLYHGLGRSFPGQAVVLDQFVDGGKMALLYVYSDTSPGDYYLFDLANKKAEHLISRRDWLDPARMGSSQPIKFAARDGLEIHGYLTLPNGSNGKNLPLVVNPHGGPFDVFDEWGFDPEVQLLASRGYAVLQVNFRGSSNYGKSFVLAGYQQWGGTMQDDLTDATLWAIKQGVADARRICIFGSSYGGYAALMGAAREPSLYRCAVGYVGIYDLKTLYGDESVADSKSATNFFKRTLGQQDLASKSPDHLADRITIPVMLVAGREDEVAPPKHTELMRDALTRAGKQVDAKIYPHEGHGFFVQEDIEDFYTRMLAFLDRNIGAGAAATSK
ncbi:MAG: S9 family peptidase [Lysobacteraceae bacterium]